MHAVVRTQVDLARSVFHTHAWQLAYSDYPAGVTPCSQHLPQQLHWRVSILCLRRLMRFHRPVPMLIVIKFVIHVTACVGGPQRANQRGALRAADSQWRRRQHQRQRPKASGLLQRPPWSDLGSRR